VARFGSAEINNRPLLLRKCTGWSSETCRGGHYESKLCQ